MADAKIRGITIKLGADTQEFTKALKGIDTQLKTTQNNLKDINKLLKLNPGNVELLTQKQKYLSDAIEQTGKRLDELKKAQEGVAKGSQEWEVLQREIIDTEGKLKSLEKDMKSFGSVSAQQMKAVGAAVQEAGSKVEAAGKKLQGISTAASGALAGLVGLGYKAMQTGDELNTLSQQTGLSTYEIQKMQYAADLVDVSFEDITAALKKMKSKMDPTNKTFQQLGVYVTDAYGNLRDADDVFYDTIKALSQIENETERDQVAMELFGKSADQLAGIVDDGGAALKEYGQQALDLGLIMKSETIDALNETNDIITATKGELQGSLAQLGATLAKNLTPLIEKASDLIGKVSERLRKLTPQQTETIMKILAVVAAIGPVLTIGGKLISGIGTIISVLGTVIGVLGGPLTLAIAAVVAAGVLLYKNWDKVKETAIKVKDGVVTAFNAIKTGVQNAITAVQTKIDALKAKFEELKNKVTSIWDTIKGIFTGEISFPKIPLPHFKILPEGWKIKDLLQGIKPSLNIDWYKRAYQNPVMFTQPTVLQTPSGAKGFGDGHGAEIVMGLDKLRELVGTQANSVVINVYPSAGMDETKLAQKIQQVYVNAARNRGLVNG